MNGGNGSCHTRGCNLKLDETGRHPAVFAPKVVRATLGSEA